MRALLRIFTTLAIALACSSPANAYYFYANTSGVYSATITPPAGCGAGCSRGPAYVKTPPISTNFSGAIQWQTGSDYVTGGSGFTHNGYAYTCVSGLYYTGVPAHPSTACKSTPRSCTSPLVGRPDGTCGQPCVVGNKLQLSGKSNGDTGFPDATVCQDYCTYVLTSDSADASVFSKSVLGVLVSSTGKYDHTWTAVYKSNAATCSMDSNPDAPKIAANPDFIQNADTKNTAQWHAGDQCGYVNGKYHCLGPIPNGSCALTPGGDGVCATTPGTMPATPPAPNTGTAGTAAQPVATVTNNSTTNNYYSPATMSGSTVTAGPATDNPTGTSNTPSGQGTTGSGGSSGSGSPTEPTPTSDCGGDGQPPCNSLSGGTDCSSPPSTGGDPIAGYSAMQDWKTACALSTPTAAQMNAAIDTGLGTTTEGGLLKSKGSVNVSGWFDGAAATGGGCPADIPVSLPQVSATINIPFSSVCPYVTLIRTLGLIGAALYSLYIVQGAF